MPEPSFGYGVRPGGYPAWAGFPACMRIKRQRDFERTYATGRSAGDQVLKVVMVSNGLAFSRLGLSVGKRYGGAIRRNRFKRLAREAFRLNRAQLPQGFDIIVIPRPQIEPSLEQVAASLVGLTAQVAVRLAGAKEPKQ